MQRIDRTEGFYHPQIETMPPADRERFQENLIRELMDYAYNNSPALKSKLDSAGIKPSNIRTFEDLAAVPLTKKEEVIDAQKANPPFGGFLAVPPAKLERVHVSPGPMFYPRMPDPESRDIRARMLFAFGFRPGDIVQNCFMYHLVTAGLELDEALRAVGCIVVPAGGGSTELQLGILQKLRVAGYVGTPSFLSLLADKAEENGLSLKDDLALAVAFCGAEMFTDTARQRLEARWGIPILQSYGVADTGLLGYECWCKSGFHIPEERVVEIVDPSTGRRVAPGEAGEVVASSPNRVMPMVRFATGDLSRMVMDPCLCGRTSPRLLGILGRTSESTKVRGMFVYPKQIEELMSRFPEVTGYQVIISREGDQDAMSLLIELAEPGKDLSDLQQRLSERVKDVIKLRAQIEVVPPGSIVKDSKKLIDNRVWR